jgi:hypothetical protein
MKSILQRLRWEIALFIAALVVAVHRIGKPAGFEAFNIISPTTFNPVPLQSHDDEPGWKVLRFPFAAAGGPALATMKAGYLVKVDAARANVNPALPADDAALEGIIIDLPNDPANPTDVTVAVAFEGSFDKNTVKYADGTQPISAAGLARLRDMSIYLDATVQGGAFAP